MIWHKIYSYLSADRPGKWVVPAIAFACLALLTHQARMASEAIKACEMEGRIRSILGVKGTTIRRSGGKVVIENINQNEVFAADPEFFEMVANDMENDGTPMLPPEKIKKRPWRLGL